MPDPITDEEKEQFEKDVADHPLTKQAEEAAAAHEKETEAFLKDREEKRKAVEEGKLEEVYANGAVVGWREPGSDVNVGDDVPADEVAPAHPKEAAVEAGAAPDESVKVTKSDGKKSDKS